MRGMEVFNWFEANWLDVLQSVGFFLTAYAFYRDSVARKIGNMIEMGKQHREVWQPMYKRPELERVEDPRAALETKPLTHEERRFVGEIILHFSTVYQAMRAGMFVEVEGLERDIKGFFTLPIPKAVWELVKPFHAKGFVKFVESCLA